MKRNPIRILCLLAVLIASGCWTPKPSPLEGAIWVMPSKPEHNKVFFTQYNNGLFLDLNNAINLLYNINENEAYTQKLELLIDTMKGYYHAK